MVAPQNRRGFLRWAARGAAALGLASAPDPAPAAPEPPRTVPVGVEFQDGERRLRLGHDDEGEPCLDVVPRWEWPEVLALPQPEPTGVEFFGVHKGRKTLIRRWEGGAPRACRLCPVCHAYRPDGPNAVCAVSVLAGLTPAEAPLYEEGGAGR